MLAKARRYEEFAELTQRTAAENHIQHASCFVAPGAPEERGRNVVVVMARAGSGLSPTSRERRPGASSRSTSTRSAPLQVAAPTGRPSAENMNIT